MRWIAARFTPNQDNTACSEQTGLQAQKALYTALSKYSPALCLRQDQFHAQEGWLLEVSSCFRLFGGAKALLNSVWNEAHAVHATVCLATHSTATGAWWLSKARPADSIQELQESLEQFASLQLQGLPSGVMDCPREVLQTFEQCGLHTIGELLKVPRSGFVQRFGLQAMGELDSAFNIQNAQAPSNVIFKPGETFETSKELPFHSSQLEWIERHTEELVQALCTWLSEMKQGTREIHFEFRQAHDSIHLMLRSANPSAQHTHWMKLLHHRLSGLKFTDDIRTVKLCCTHTESAPERNASLLPSQTQADTLADTHWDITCDVLRARLGEQTVLFADMEHDPRPEHSIVLNTAKTNRTKPRRKQKQFAQSPAQGMLSHSTPRPLWLLPEPKPLTTNPNWHTDAAWQLISGPERVEFGWWDSQPCLRDYYCALDKQGSLVWVYEDHQHNKPDSTQWYLHGVFA